MKYQEKVSTRRDVRMIYEKVMANPRVREYRGYTDAWSYGWDAATGSCVKREGEVWFVNPAFVEDRASVAEEREGQERGANGVENTPRVPISSEDLVPDDEEEIDAEWQVLLRERDGAKEELFRLRQELASVQEGLRDAEEALALAQEKSYTVSRLLCRLREALACLLGAGATEE